MVGARLQLTPSRKPRSAISATKTKSVTTQAKAALRVIRATSGVGVVMRPTGRSKTPRDATGSAQRDGDAPDDDNTPHEASLASRTARPAADYTSEMPADPPPRVARLIQAR